jgi:flagellum-specific peptidoglycan hydrolase FlgJ
MEQQQINAGQNIAAALQKVLTDNGHTTDKLGMLLLQVALETGGFKSHVAQVNNMSGIKWNPTGNTVKGEYDSKIKSAEGDNYAGFDSLDNWANKYYQIINRGTNKPLDAANIDDFAARLKENGYFTDTLSNYSKALKSWIPTIKKYIGSVSGKTFVSIGAVVVLLVLILLINQ